MAHEDFTDISREDLRQAQKIMLYIMKKIHAVCVKHRIRYWLDYGTLLGAIRHDGFIPWDDDLDICMMREDYEKFCQVAPAEFGEEFFVQTPETTEHFYFAYGKVRLVDSLWLETRWQYPPLQHSGLFVDIFPHDPFPQSRLKVLLLVAFRKIFDGVINQKIRKQKAGSFIKVFPRWCCAKLLPVSFMVRQQQRIIRNLQQYRHSSKLVSKLCMDTTRDLCDRAIFDELILHKFEDAEFYIPARYDERLKMLFNDYMILPPENKRFGRHGVLKYDFGKYKDL